MRTKIMASLLAAGCLFGSCASVFAQDMNGVLVGIDAREKSNYGYLGYTRHYGENPLDDGIISRFVGFSGRYKYDSTAVSSGHVNGDYKAFKALVGYKKNFDSFVLLSYIGAEFEEHDLSPKNIADRNRGNHWGGKARVDLETNFSSQNYGNLIATYGTARDRYWVRARGGRDFSGYVVGPEIIATGDREAHEERIGAFLNFRNFLPAYLSVSAGQAKSPKTSAGYTPYITMEYSTTF